MTTPASTCFRCRREGTPSEQQTRITCDGTRAAGDTLNFYCPHCLNTWYTPRLEAQAQGAFLDQAGLR